jgi:exosortase/archaeosortase family protein
MIFLRNNYSIYINESCSGFKQMFQILILFVLFPGPWKHKLWFIPAAIVSMFFVNVIRVIGLSYAMIYMPQHWDFIHLWIMRPFYYVAIFIMWVIWVEKFRNTHRKEANLTS